MTAALAFALACAGCVSYCPEAPNVEPYDERDPVADFASCMTFEDFRAANMGEAWRTTAVAGGGDCTSCHGDGSALAALWPGALPDEKFFGELTHLREALLVFYKLAPGGRLVVDEERIRAIGEQPGHPAFDPAAGFAATRYLGEATMARVAAAGGPCGPDPLID